MNQENYQFIVKSMQDLGFDDPRLHQLVKQKIESGLFIDKPFTVSTTGTAGKDKLKFEFNVQRSTDPNYEDYYNIKHITMTLTPEKGEAVEIRFPHFKAQKYPLDQMYQMGKQNEPVYKKDRYEKVGVWAKVNSQPLEGETFMRVRTYADDVTNFNLSRHLDNLPVKWANGEKEEAMQDLRNGIPVTVTVKLNGNVETDTIKVSPQLNSLIMINKDGQVVQRTNNNSISLQTVEELPAQRKAEDNGVKAKEVVENMNKPQQESKGPKKKVG